ncbi:oxysterol binding, putative [Ichthyophthirius multifiliis]|uniref:Oxysterol binding, putative n=1 Tax=Ichthyophthirius multifiliis TaxID=5932 RepID=G0QZ52_ICHMU|nr:oxysterol binding, putative [Ichthyophthirius multifiliis]EGR29503.1 oxysterol binding, putative [Ichthyophthirius multifiliis]|eukprot:XP_004030739.1 oxysterol binding, putative [Ichthyophthirius multifiliis]
MIPKSALEKALYSTCLFPLYMNLAAQTNNYIERFKFVICATLGNFYINCGFLKPLNPILGETCSGYYLDGTKMYAEQISHHPPVSYFLVYGPNGSYLQFGNYNYESNAGINSLQLKNKGNRQVKFYDGQTIKYNYVKEVYSGSFFGSMKVESKGSLSFQDSQNGIFANIDIDQVKKKPSDYFQGEIKCAQNGVSIKIYGTYMGYIEFDGDRYWDYRHIMPFKPIFNKNQLKILYLYMNVKLIIYTLQIGVHLNYQQNTYIYHHLSVCNYKYDDDFFYYSVKQAGSVLKQVLEIYFYL